jgi:hypothetical protein
MRLINVKETYDVIYEDKEAPKDKWPVFTLRRLSAGEVNSIDDEITISRGDESFAYLGGTATKMKINLAVVSWRNVELEEGKDAPCTAVTKELLPSVVQQFLVKRIDEDNGLRKTKQQKEDEKNS